MTDGHYARYQEMLDQVDWNKYGVVQGVARDPRCENCMVHCGYDPSGALGVDYRSGDTWKNIKYNFGARPKPSQEGLSVDPYNGASVGKGHLAEAKAAMREETSASEGGCLRWEWQWGTRGAPVQDRRQGIARLAARHRQASRSSPKNQTHIDENAFS